MRQTARQAKANAKRRKKEAKETVALLLDAVNLTTSRSQIVSLIAGRIGVPTLTGKRVAKMLVSRVADCGRCGKVYLLTRAGKLYCSSKCQKAAKSKRARESGSYSMTMIRSKTGTE